MAKKEPNKPNNMKTESNKETAVKNKTPPTKTTEMADIKDSPDKVVVSPVKEKDNKATITEAEKSPQDKESSNKTATPPGKEKGDKTAIPETGNNVQDKTSINKEKQHRILSDLDAIKIANTDLTLKKNAPKKIIPLSSNKAEEKEKKIKADEKRNQNLSPADEELKKEQEALLKSLDEKEAYINKDNKPKKNSSKLAPVVKDEKPISNNMDLEKRKQKLEQELREKYGIPKTGKTIEPWVAPETEQVVRITHDKLHSFKDHPFNVDTQTVKFKAFVSSIRAHGVTQPATVRPREDGGYEIVSGHRRDAGSIEAGIPYTPCIIRALNDDQAIQQMVEDNVNNREVGTMELAKALKHQLNSIKHQGAREALDNKNLSDDADENIVKRSNEIIAERNGMSVKQVQRYIALTNLTPSLQEMVDGKSVGSDKIIKLSFTPAVEMSYLKPKNQDYVAVAIEGNESTPSLSQAQRLKKLDQQGILNPDMIDGILMEEKKEADKVILSSQELAQYFGKDKSPQDMKGTIMKLLEEWKGQQKNISAPDKKPVQEK